MCGVDGGISPAELQKFFLSSLMVTINENIREVTEYFVDKVFKTIGQGKEGDDAVLTAAQVQDYVAKHPEVVDVYSLFGRSMTTERVSHIDVHFLVILVSDTSNIESSRLQKQEF